LTASIRLTFFGASFGGPPKRLVEAGGALEPEFIPKVLFASELVAYPKTFPVPKPDEGLLSCFKVEL
jgi:hypothetical protein